MEQGRWTRSYGGSDSHLKLVSRAPQLTIGSEIAFSIGLVRPGAEYHMDDFAANLVVHAPLDTAPGLYDVDLYLEDENALVGDGGTVTLRFQVADTNSAPTATPSPAQCASFQVRLERLVHPSAEAASRIQVAATGGSTPYTYQWTNGASGPLLTGVPALDGAPYTVTARDAAGCSTELSLVLDWNGPESFLALDGQAIVATGIYAGLPNPNFNHFTWIVIQSSGVLHHKAMRVYSGPNLGPTNTAVVRTANILPEAGDAPFLLVPGALGSLYANRLRSRLPVDTPGVLGRRSIRNLPAANLTSTVQNYLQIRSFHALSVNQPGIYNVEQGRWTRSYGPLTLKLISVSPTLRIGSENSLGIGLEAVGDTFVFAENIDLVLHCDVCSGDMDAILSVSSADGSGSGDITLRALGSSNPSPAPAELPPAETSVALIVGLTLGLLAALAIAITLFFYLRRRAKQFKAKNGSQLKEEPLHDLK